MNASIPTYLITYKNGPIPGKTQLNKLTQEIDDLNKPITTGPPCFIPLYFIVAPNYYVFYKL